MERNGLVKEREDRPVLPVLPIIGHITSRLPSTVQISHQHQQSTEPYPRPKPKSCGLAASQPTVLWRSIHLSPTALQRLLLEPTQCRTRGSDSCRPTKLPAEKTPNAQVRHETKTLARSRTGAGTVTAKLGWKCILNSFTREKGERMSAGTGASAAQRRGQERRGRVEVVLNY